MEYSRNEIAEIRVSLKRVLNTVQGLLDKLDCIERMQGNNQNIQVARQGSITEKVYFAIQKIDSHTFSIHDVQEKLSNEMGKEANAATVTTSLHRLIFRGAPIEVESRGGGRKKTVYRRIPDNYIQDDTDTSNMEERYVR